MGTGKIFIICNTPFSPKSLHQSCCGPDCVLSTKARDKESSPDTFLDVGKKRNMPNDVQVFKEELFEALMESQEKVCTLEKEVEELTLMLANINELKNRPSTAASAKPYAAAVNSRSEKAVLVAKLKRGSKRVEGQVLEEF